MKRTSLIIRLMLLCSLLFGDVLYVAAMQAGTVKVAPVETSEVTESVLVEATPEAIEAANDNTSVQAPATTGREFSQVFFASKDAYVDSATPTTNYGLTPMLLINSYYLSKEQSLLHFNVNDFPENAVILTATLELYSDSTQVQTPA